MKNNHVGLLAQQEEDFEDEESPEDPRSVQLQRYGENFLIWFCVILITYYLLASILAWLSYREFKGVAEDIAGGSVTMTTFGNVLHYAVIDKREEDAIADREAKRLRLEEIRKEAEEDQDKDENGGDGGGD